MVSGPKVSRLVGIIGSLSNVWVALLGNAHAFSLVRACCASRVPRHRTPYINLAPATQAKLSGAKDGTNRHHELSGSVQFNFFKKVGQLFTSFQEMGNPFQDESAHLPVLDTKDIVDPVTSKLVITHHGRGKDQFNSFMKGLQKDKESSFYQPIKKNKISFFKQEEVATGSKEKVLKENCLLFPTLCFLSKQAE